MLEALTLLSVLINGTVCLTDTAAFERLPLADSLNTFAADAALTSVPLADSRRTDTAETAFCRGLGPGNSSLLLFELMFCLCLRRQYLVVLSLTILD